MGERGGAEEREREDLGARFFWITRRLIAAEQPLLERHGLTMWQYAVLGRLADGSTPTQLALADAVGYDKTRLIGLLEELEAAGLISRERDPSDRRARVVALTAAGRRRFSALRRAIHAMEDELLAGMPAAERAALDRALARLLRDPS